LGALNYQENGVNIYFLGPGILDNAGAGLLDGTPLDPHVIIHGGGFTEANTPVVETIALAHEMGHSLGLWHTDERLTNAFFDNISCTTNEVSCQCWDMVMDTYPEEFNAGYFCTNHATCEVQPECGAVIAGLYPDVLNIMDAGTPIECRLHGFTEGQIRRMKRYISSCVKLDEISASTIEIAPGMNLTYDTPIAGCLPDITIHAGATLTISTTISMAAGKKILVKKGGRLVVDGGTITGCNGAYWKGIVVEGDASLAQNSTNQGVVRLWDNAVVEFATNPLEVYGGGWVVAENATFIYGGGSIFYPYNKANFNRFVNCTFTSDANFGLANLPYHVFLSGQTRLPFTNCHFSAEDLPVSSASQYAGIYAFNSKFSVANSDFTRFYTAIFAANGGSNRNFSIKGTDFIDNFVGIENWGVNNAIITGDNTFTGIGAHPYAPVGPSVTPYNAGIKLVSCTGFTVEGNTFTGDGAFRDYSMGVLAYNTGSVQNRIRKNIFDGLLAGNQAELLNRDPGTPVFGLQYLCNENTSVNYYDFYVFDTGIAFSQGAGLATQNTFTHFSANKGDFNNTNNDGTRYFHDPSVEGTPPTQWLLLRNCPDTGYRYG
jgi:hypothetical protein